MSLPTKYKCLASAFLAMALSLPNLSFAAGGNSRLVIVLDASASMWGKIDGKDKITLVRSGLPELLNKQAPRTQFGLVTFGNKAKSGCHDVSIAIKPGTLSNKAFLKKANAIKMGGKSPISAALTRAAGLVSAQDSILLVSDGIDDCNADPCATAQALKEKKPALRIHVLGFPNQAATEQLRCIASKTGGNFALVSDAAGFPNLMATLPTKAPGKPVPVGTPGILQLSSSGNHQATKLAADYLIFDHNGNHVASFTARTGITQTLPAGEYEISALWGAAKRTARLSVAAGQTTTHNVDFGLTGTLALEAQNNAHKPVDAHFSVYTQSGDYVAEHLFKSQMSAQLPVGKYKVKATLDAPNTPAQEALIDVKPNTQNIHLFEFNQTP